MIRPQDIIAKYSVEELCATAEAYFAGIADPTPQMAKPFSTLPDAPHLLRNLGHLLAGLHLAKTMTVLEFAAGTCWLSRLLIEAQCLTISCDVSKTALELGQRLFRESPPLTPPLQEPRFLPFDGHQIDLPDASVDRIICNDGFHHIPNQEEVIAEFARVLRPGGVAGFCEPGEFHSQTAQSQHEMRNYRVLENDISVAQIFELSRKHGFTDIRLRFLGDLEVSLEDHLQIVGDRPSRKLRKAILRNVRQSMGNQAIFFLHKGPLQQDSRGQEGLAHSLSLSRISYSIRAGEELVLPLQVTNTGSARWLTENIQNIGVVAIGGKLYDRDGQLLDLHFLGQGLSHPAEPGTNFTQEIRVSFKQPGSFRLSLDLFAIGVCWFENCGSRPLTVEVEVR